MKKSFSLFLITALVFLSASLFAQEKWNQNPQQMRMPGIGQSSLPVVTISNYVNPNVVSRIINSPAGVTVINPNIRVHPNNSNYQSEVYLTRNPANPLILFGAANTYTAGQSSPYLYSTGYYVSTNGGANWYGNDTLNSNYGDPGPIFDKNGVMIMTYLGNPNGMKSARSTNFGVTWEPGVSMTTGSVDKNLANTDEAPTSAFYGRSYCVWSNFAASAPPIVVSYTTNGGQSWSAQFQINTPPSSHYSQGCDVVVNNSGVVYVTWAAPITGSPYTEDYFGFAKSTNGGVTWTVTENAFDGNGIRGTLANKNSLRVNSFPRIDVDKTSGKIYIVTSQKNLAPAGSDADIVLHSSTDGGTTWSAGVRVNQDALNNGKTQWLPAVKVDEYGGVNIVYYDDRNVLTDSAEIYVSRSIDGGATWTDILVSDARTQIKPIVETGIATGYGGDYIGITCANNKVYPFWMDRRTGIWQAFVTTIDLGPSITHNSLGNTEQIAGTRAVNCLIIPAGSPINPSTVKLYYSKDNPTLTSNITMTNSSGNNWTAALPLSGAGLYRYYITATDNSSRTATYPAGAPANTVSFTAAADIIKPVITHTAIGNTPKQSWPVLVSSTVTDNIGVDSAWVRWYKNSTANYKQFKLVNTSGSIYAAQFNSLNSDVLPGDTIFYRIIAQDNSTGHNRDSTALYKFAITNLIATNSCKTLWLPIRDNVTSYDSFQVGTHTSIIKVNFTMAQLIHTYDGDLTFALRSPAGTEVVLCAAHGSSGDNFINTVFNDSAATSIASGTAPFTGTYTPDNPLSAFIGQDPFGYWRLRVTDGAGGDTGHVGQYCVQIYSGSVILNTGNENTAPKVFSLAQNFPNPFNPTTQIRYDIAKQSFVTLKVYDLLGREITNLVNEVKQPGSFIVDFNASNLSSGVYFYKIEAGDFVSVKRMVLVK